VELLFDSMSYTDVVKGFRKVILFTVIAQRPVLI